MSPDAETQEVKAMKHIAIVPIGYVYDPAHKGAPYKVGDKYMNAGELKECIAKAVHKLLARKDGNVAFDAGSDVPEYNASVKSSRATLTCKELAGRTMAEKLDDYFARVASTEFWWVELQDELCIIYKMNAAKFRKFTERFATINSRNVIRFTRTSSKMLAWLDANA